MPIDDHALQERLDALRDKRGVPGASLAVLTGDGVATAASGVLNMATGVEATVDSLFQIGSITKVWTTTVVMQLVDEGKVELDAPVRRYLPEFRVADPDVSEAVTIRHLLTHTSGIDGDHIIDTGRGDDVLARYVDSCAVLRQVHPMGATWSYCNSGFSVLGRVIEVVTGSVWDAEMKARLFDPLQLAHTATLPEDVLRYRAALGHIRPPGSELHPSPVWGIPRSAGPAGTICSTASDVLTFARHHLEGSDSLRSMQVPQAEVPGGGIALFSLHWGLGWAVFSWNGRTVIGHDGGTIGQSAFLRVVPDAGVAICLLTNGGGTIALFDDLCRELMLETAGVQMPPPVKPLDDPPGYDASRYIGTYERECSRIEVAQRGDQLVATQTVTGPAATMTPEPFDLELVPYAADVFLTRHPAIPEMWVTATFLDFGDGTSCIHLSGRATPKVA